MNDKLTDEDVATRLEADVLTAVERYLGRRLTTRNMVDVLKLLTALKRGDDSPLAMAAAASGSDPEIGPPPTGNPPGGPPKP